MKNYRPTYFDVSDWSIIEEKVVNDFTENENPISIVEVLIGSLEVEELGIINQRYSSSRTPITRWITRGEYDYLCANEGTVIW